MKTKLILLMTVVTTALVANPLLSRYKTPHQTIPFNEIKNEHYLPAFKQAMTVHLAEIEKIVNNKQKPTFENTIIALENAGGLLDQVGAPFYNLMSSETSDELQAIAEQLSPLMTEHSNSIRLNEKLFERVKAVYEQRDQLKLTAEQATLLKNTYDGFANNGANLSPADKELYRQLSKELSLLTLQFGQNVLKETNQWNLVIDDENLLAGLPQDVKEMLAMNAKRA
ncbi:MAG: peptidase M3, partial [Bacteroidales bacterium]|nr:peptidase M3 [Bacteroidales bacterium]